MIEIGLQKSTHTPHVLIFGELKVRYEHSERLFMFLEVNLSLGGMYRKIQGAIEGKY